MGGMTLMFCGAHLFVRKNVYKFLFDKACVGTKNGIKENLFDKYYISVDIDFHKTVVEVNLLEMLSIIFIST